MVPAVGRRPRVNLQEFIPNGRWCCLTDRLRGAFIEPARQAGLDVDELARIEVAKEVPLGRVGEPPDLADLVTFLCSAPAAYLTGLAVAVDGGRIRSIV